MPASDALDPQTGEIVDFECANYYLLLEVLAKLNTLQAQVSKAPAASNLVSEYYSNQDLDGNGLIYGIDFYISNDAPVILQTLPKRGVPMTWAAYLKSVS